MSDYNQLPSNLNNSYRKDFGCIKEMIIDWLQSEIKKCNKKFKKYNPNQQPIYNQEESKIQMNISVAQTAYLFKLMNSKGLISNKTNTDILNVLVEKFRTPKAENISYESLHNKYYNIEDKTKESVHELLKSLLRS